jgi:MYXO-CTERM domain-containing protein
MEALARRTLLAAAALALATSTTVLGDVPALALPVVLDPSAAVVAGDQLAVAPAALRIGDGTTRLAVTLGSDAPSDLVVTLRSTLLRVDGSGVSVATDTPADWLRLPDTATPLAPGETLRVALVVDGAPPGAAAAVEVVGTAAGGGTAVATAVVLAPGPTGGDGPPRVTATRTGAGTTVDIEADRPTLVTVTAAGRGAPATAADRLVLPGRTTTVLLPTPAAPWPVAVAVVDDAGREAVVRLGPTVPPGAVGAAVGVLGLAVLAGLGLRRRRRRAAAT